MTPPGLEGNERRFGWRKVQPQHEQSSSLLVSHGQTLFSVFAVARGGGYLFWLPPNVPSSQCRGRNTHAIRSFHGKTRRSGHEELKLGRRKKKSH